MPNPTDWRNAKRTVVFLEPELHTEARVRAVRAKKSLTWWIHDLVERAVKVPEKKGKAGA